MIKSFEEFHGLNESKDAYTLPKREMKIAKAAKNHPAPYTVIAVDLRNKRVVGQEIGLKTWEAIPAAMLKLSRDFPNARVHVEDHGGAVILESAVTTYKKGDKLIIDMGNGPEEVEVMVPPGKSIQSKYSGIQFIELKRKKGAPYTITVSRLKKAIIEESAEMLPSYEVIAGLAVALGALDLAQAARSGKSIILDVAKLLRAELGSAVEATGAKAKQVVDKYKGNPKVKGIIMDAEEAVEESLSESEIKIYKTISKKEWDKTHRDSKSIINGVHYKMFNDPKLGTILAPVQISEGLNEREYSDAQREAMADSGEALPDGSFPIADETDLKNAIQAYGRAKNQSAAAKHIAKRARALGLSDLIPQTPDFQASLK